MRGEPNEMRDDEAISIKIANYENLHILRLHYDQ